MEKRWLTVLETSKLLSLHPQTIYSLIGRDKIPHVKIGGAIRVDLVRLNENFEREEQARRTKGGLK